MKEIQFSMEINASKERVWTTLWEDVTFRDWANIIDEGTYMKGTMKEGNEIQYISSVNGYGVTSLIEKLNPNEFVLLSHCADTEESGQQEREKEWTGGTESYSLTEKNGVTTLIVKIDVPEEQEETFNIRFPRALERLKTLAEKCNYNVIPMKNETEESSNLITFESYFQQFPQAVQEILQKIRRVIQEAAPEATEKMTYQMPTFYLKGNLVHFAAYKRHIGFYPAPSGIEAFMDQIKGYKYAKGSVQFPLDQPIPYGLITEIVSYRVKENIQIAAIKASGDKDKK